MHIKDKKKHKLKVLRFRPAIILYILIVIIPLSDLFLAEEKSEVPAKLNYAAIQYTVYEEATYSQFTSNRTGVILSGYTSFLGQ